MEVKKHEKQTLNMVNRIICNRIFNKLDACTEASGFTFEYPRFICIDRVYVLTINVLQKGES